jgi:hypothetical protein
MPKLCFYVVNFKKFKQLRYKTMLHPKEILSTQIIEKLREETFISEERKCLSARTLDIIYRENRLQYLIDSIAYWLPPERFL